MSEIDWWQVASRRVERLRELLKLKAPGAVVRAEVELVQKAVDNLYPDTKE